MNVTDNLLELLTVITSSFETAPATVGLIIFTFLFQLYILCVGGKEFVAVGSFSPTYCDITGFTFSVFSSLFSHASFSHFIGNMSSLWIFGRILEAEFRFRYGKVLGIINLISIYIFSHFIDCYKKYRKYSSNNPTHMSLGASGSVCAIITIALMLNSDFVIAVGDSHIPGLLWLVLYSFFSFLGNTKADSQIGHMSHLNGIYFGIFISLLLVSDFDYLERNFRKTYMLLKMTDWHKMFNIILNMATQMKW